MTDAATPGSDEVVRLSLDQDRCIGGGQCEMLEPGVFLLDDDALSSIVGDPTVPRRRAEVVVDRCPGRAITAASVEQSAGE